MKDAAIMELYSSVTTVAYDSSTDTYTAYDDSGNVVSYVEATVTAKQTELENASKLADLRAERNKKLAETDYLALSDNTLTSGMSTYRQALRDITDNYSDLNTVVWPTKP